MDGVIAALLKDVDTKSFILGFVAAGIVGFVVQQYRLTTKKVGAYFKPQAAIVYTKDSPAAVARGCSCQVILMILILALLAAGAYYLRTHHYI
jgi:hypothetical protein